MPIRIQLKEDLAFTPEDAAVLIAVIEDTLKALGLVDRDDPTTLLVAQKVIEAARLGQRDPKQLRSCVLANLSGATPRGAAARSQEASHTSP